jgi:hypothetical protein
MFAMLHLPFLGLVDLEFEMRFVEDLWIGLRAFGFEGKLIGLEWGGW